MAGCALLESGSLELARTDVSPCRRNEFAVFRTEGDLARKPAQFDELTTRVRVRGDVLEIMHCVWCRAGEGSASYVERVCLHAAGGVVNARGAPSPLHENSSGVLSAASTAHTDHVAARVVLGKVEVVGSRSAGNDSRQNEQRGRPYRDGGPRVMSYPTEERRFVRRRGRPVRVWSGLIGHSGPSMAASRSGGRCHVGRKCAEVRCSAGALISASVARTHMLVMSRSVVSETQKKGVPTPARTNASRRSELHPWQISQSASHRGPKQDAAVVACSSARSRCRRIGTIRAHRMRRASSEAGSARTGP